MGCCQKPDISPPNGDDPEEQKESQEPGLIPIMQPQEEGNESQEQGWMPAVEEENEVQDVDYVTLMEAAEESESLEPGLMQSMDGMQPIRRKLGCKQLKKLEKKIFKICRHSRRGFTWKQTLRCEVDY